MNNIIIARANNHYWRINMHNKNSKNNRGEKYKKCTAVLPYINDSISKRIKDIINTSGIDCKIAFKNYRIYRFTDSQRYSKRIDKDISNKKGVIYRVDCITCADKGITTCYIGETGRALGTRIKEHFYINKNIEKRSEVCTHSLAQHDIDCVKNWRASILAHEADQFKRIAKEAIFINKCANCINKNKGYQIMGH